MGALRPGGTIIRAARARAGITQTELARLMGTGQSVVARWESGSRSPTYETILKAVELCGCELEVLLRPHGSRSRRLAMKRMLELPLIERLELIGREGRNLLELDEAIR